MIEMRTFFDSDITLLCSWQQRSKDHCHTFKILFILKFWVCLYVSVCVLRWNRSWLIGLSEVAKIL